MVNIFIDTNIFLGLYESNNNKVSQIFDDITKLKKRLIIPEQVYDEFLRNRDSVLQKQINSSNKNKVEIHTTALIRHMEEYDNLKTIKDDFDEKNKLLIQKLKDLQTHSDDDPILNGFLDIYNSKDVKKIKRTETIIQKAKDRMLMGNPPIDKKKGTIGDQIIWETLLENLNDDVIFVTEDNTYVNHKLFIENEFLNVVGKKIFITDRVSVALKQVNETPSEALIEFEKTKKSKDFIEEDEIKDLLAHFETEGIDISPNLLFFLFKYSKDNYNVFKEEIGITSEIEKRYQKPFHSIHSDYITIYRKYFNPEHSPYMKKEDNKS
ncbi:PIN domain-containing protein [Methanococcoides burtonii]|uniref:DUF4935 domain-containing protein n=1 Tax=Methanococcoides burtonii (strain DSM 6242 / NBRC 107633 / OCM 468 / ACE-M) TaxID=259564 RepID=Q12YD6_METBU|nr:PIN domain-containing protein [Methanococcoides burtonii]ABE51540.1 Hypothetical protein Mbur_0565 [Methanococcoides burtonii DSM 6242]